MNGLRFYEPWPLFCVYFLCSNTGEILYVGRSRFLPGRVRRHLETIDFDYVRFAPCRSQSEAEALEQEWIARLRPSWNKLGVPNWAERWRNSPEKYRQEEARLELGKCPGCACKWAWQNGYCSNCGHRRPKAGAR